jgi:hypothetical protein
MREWLAAREWIMGAVEDEDDTEAAIVERLKAGTAMLWLGERSAMITEINDTEAGRVLHVWLAGGELAEVVSFTPGIAAFGRMMGCVDATLEGRKGWARALRPYGFSGSRVLRKAL